MPQWTRTYSGLTAAVLGLAVLEGPALAQNVPQCVMSGTPSTWGVNSTGNIAIRSGRSCLFSLQINGEILNSSVSQNPAHGTLQQVNLSTFIYKSQAGYRGRDTFSVQANGTSRLGSGTSVLTVNATMH